MELGMEPLEIGIAVGVVLIVLIVLDGIRRMFKSHRQRLKVSIEPVSFQGETEEFNSELPNGGARMISPAQFEGELANDVDISLDGRVVYNGPSDEESDFLESEPVDSFDVTVPMLMESVSDSEDGPGEGSGFSQRLAIKEEQQDMFGASASGRSSENDLDEDSGWGDSPVSAPINKAADASTVSVSAPPAFVAGEKLTDIDVEVAAERVYEQVVKEDALVEDGSQSASPVSEVVIIHAIAKSGYTFVGRELLALLLQSGLRFGEMNIFHRHEELSGQGEHWFSMANAVEPGVFDIEVMNDGAFQGVSFFLALPGPNRSVAALNAMLEVAQQIAHELNGELKDEQHGALTQQAVEHLKQRVQDFERKQHIYKR